MMNDARAVDTERLQRYQAMNDRVAHKAKQNLWMVVAFVVALIVLVGVTLALGINWHDVDSVTAPFKRVKDDAVIPVFETFDEGGTWQVPEMVSNNGRVLITMSGGGGGGCTGTSAHAGGGGNAGVSVVRYPAILSDGDTCTMVIGSGGDANVDGTATTLKCTDDDAQEHVDLSVEGGRSGCTFFNGTQSRRGDAESYPYVAERVGGRPSNGFAAERHPFGGAPGTGKAGGAGSVYGDGANGATADFEKGDDVYKHAYGAGGGGGGKQGGVGGSGRKGFITIIYYADVKEENS